MQCLVLVKFLSGGALPPEEFFRRIDARWSWLEETDDAGLQSEESGGSGDVTSVRSALCIADFDSIEQLTMDLAIMPGAGISSVEVVPVSEGAKSGCCVKDRPISD